MKKIIALALCLIMAAGLLASCSQQKKNDGKTRIVVSIFPVYDWVRQIVGDKSDSVEVSLLLDSGVDLHSYQLTTDDIAEIADADLLIGVGGESDKWIDEVVPASGNDDLKVVLLLDLLGDRAKEEELVEGMQGEEEEEGPEYDEHVWLSLKNASFLTEKLAGVLSDVDKERADLHKKNAAAYAAKLDEVDKKYEDTVSAAPVKTILFGDRFPFRYMADDYGLTYYAAFVGCSSESESSFETVAFLAGQVDELGLKHVLQIETSDGAIARTVIESTKTKDQDILTLDSLQNATGADGETYLDVMESNLDVLKKALN